MPSKKLYKLQGDELMMRACHDVLHDIEGATGLRCRLLLEPTTRKGVFLVTCVAERLHGPSDARKVALAAREWPRSEVVSLAAACFAQANSLAKTIDEAYGALAEELKEQSEMFGLGAR
jgi:hypothetical protein